MKLPIDTSGFTFMVALAPEPVLDFESKRQKASEDGELLWSVQLVALGEGSAQILPVKVAGQPSPAIKQGVPVRVTGLVASPWSMDGGRSGVSFRASKIEAVAPAKAGA